ncbi:hypothetical protein GALMADRAFT_233069 [Galerina marginata CBS 339.88]|uniref:Uncharacterized protein n=1 Tax=Galerina marginata (strain CBS 339.88) TaxID=685588 RepID=A0A067U089_GALM3|nr:hypothetical protein GALMADRAFT_233069 [Galerina marginata CBS 339.88]
MSNKRRDPLPRLSIAPNLNMQQPGQNLFSPALPTSLQQSFHPAFPMSNPLQTPMQSFFTNTPGAPGRLSHAHHASIQLAAAGILPPNYGTPVVGHFPRPSMMLAPGVQPQAPSHPFPNRNRRQPSIGGPPKAVLGGPARKVSPLPPGAVGPPSASTPAPAAPPQKAKKVIVNLPKETVAGEEGEPATRPSWARSPLTNEFEYKDITILPAEITTAESYPPDAWRLNLPNSIDVYLPGKLAWDTIKQKNIEEKLEKLGVERGSGSNVPHIHAPHARAASISSPADPAVLLYKLNKLHQAQEASSAGNSLSVSPQPPFTAPLGLSPSPNRGMRFLTNRHGHTMSLAQPPSYQSSLFSVSPSPFNPFGPGAILGSESIADSQISESSADGIHAPQGRVPMTAPSFVPPLSAVGGNKSHVDFIRGFGLDVPQESEEEDAQHNGDTDEYNDGDATQDMELDENDGDIELDDGTTTAPQSRLHSRHVSKLSAALSLRSVGGNFTSQFKAAPEEVEQQNRDEEEADDGGDEADKENEPPHNQEIDPVEEWTGSEDLYLGLETSDDESIGEWSNPSDEERARQQRVDRRLRRRAAQQQQVDQPRRLPEFPRPPENPLGFIPRREDDIISNPSEEENFMRARQAEFVGVSAELYHPERRHRPMSALGLPPHSRGPSDQYSAHDPAMAHSRHGSENFAFPQSVHQSNPSTGRRDSLNPFAKPFVFGAPRDSGSWQPFGGQSTPPTSMPSASISMPSASTLTHSRLPSIGKPLNVAAPEFKPGGFSFHLPGAPQMPTAPPTFPEPSHEPQEPIPSVESTPFKVQGREKRQRHGSGDSMEEGDSMASFKFPMKLDSSPQSIRRHRSGSLSGPTRNQLDTSAQPFTFAGFSAIAHNMPSVPKADAGNMVESDALPDEENLNDSSTAKADNSEVQADEVKMPVTTKQKRAPIPLDFKHPVSSNTVPAGLFKALVNDDRTRRGVRSRLSSREIFEHMHRPSMDDDDVALIAQKNPRTRLVTDPGERPSPSAADDVFGSTRHSRRRSSLPDALHDEDLSPSEVSIAPQDLTTRMEFQHIEDILSQLLDEKLAGLRHQLSRESKTGDTGLSLTTESMMTDVISLFRTQLQESATRSLEDSQMDARGELDFQMIKDVVEESQKELLVAFQREIQRVAQHAPSTYAANASQEVLPVIEQVGSRTIDAVVEAISELSARQEAAALNAPAHEHDLIIDKLVNALSPMMHSLHSDPIDYEFLTRELTQAVKPHISQLIDLASDKRETAGLIVDRILPLLPSLKNVSIDTDAITLELITEVRRAIAPIDAFEIKEQVADLVVERLDSRLAVRDKTFNVDVVTSRVTESVSQLLDSLNTVPAALNELAAAQKAVEERQTDLAASQSQIFASIAELPNHVTSQLESLETIQKDILKKVDQPVAAVPEPDGNILVIRNVVEALASEQNKLAEQGKVSSSETKAILDKLDALPQEFSGMANSLQSALVELIASHASSKHELEELRKLNTDYQIQVTKARGSHGQVRVEKDVLSEKLAIMEGDRDRLRAQNKELQAAASEKAKETSALEGRNTELEQALANALARLQSSDVASEANQRSIVDLEKANKELIAEKQTFKSEVDSLHLEIGFTNREKAAASKALETLQSQHAQLASQQRNWDVLNAATEKINMAFNLLENPDSKEQKELRHHRDRSQALEDENATLLKRYKDLENKLANSDRSASTTRQTLAQAQQRSSEWERRAKEYEGRLEMVQTKFEQAEQTQSQLEADYQLVKMQLEEREADSRLHQDRENKLRDQMTALESKCVLLQKELEKANAAKLSAPSPTPFRPQANGNAHPPPRPDSRTSTIYDPRIEASNRRISSYSSARSMTSTQSVNQPSVWDSMHAPAATNGQSKWAAPPPMHTPVSRYSNLAPTTPKQHRPSYNQYQRGPSPTPSNVSAAPTQGDDGWWE